MEEKICAKLLQTILQLGSLSENCGHKMSIADRNNVSYNPMLENCTQDIDASEANFHIYSKNKYCYENTGKLPSRDFWLIQ